MEGNARTDRSSPSWAALALVTAGTAVMVAVAVVGLTVAMDRFSEPGIVIDSADGPGISVHVTGAVATPGVYDLVSDSRLADAVFTAGGLSPDADTAQLNLAARMSDGERVDIPSRQPTPARADGTTPVQSLLVNVNTASAPELEALPGIGPVLAGRIVDDRAANGPYLTVEALNRVDGISDSTIDELRPLVMVDE